MFWKIGSLKETERKKLSFRCDKKFKFENEIKKFLGMKKFLGVEDNFLKDQVT